MTCFMFSTTHSIEIANRKAKKTAYYITCNLPFVEGPPHVCVAPKKSARYEFEICPPKRGNYKGVVVFQPGPWPIKYVRVPSSAHCIARLISSNRDVDSDGDEIPPLEPENPADFKYSLWFTVDINVQAPDAQASVDLVAPCLVRLLQARILWLPRRRRQS